MKYACSTDAALVKNDSGRNRNGKAGSCNLFAGLCRSAGKRLSAGAAAPANARRKCPWGTAGADLRFGFFHPENKPPRAIANRLCVAAVPTSLWAACCYAVSRGSAVSVSIQSAANPTTRERRLCAGVAVSQHWNGQYGRSDPGCAGRHPSQWDQTFCPAVP